MLDSVEKAGSGSLAGEQIYRQTQTWGDQSHSRSEKREVRKGAVEAAWPTQRRKLNLGGTAGPKA